MEIYTDRSPEPANITGNVTMYIGEDGSRSHLHPHWQAFEAPPYAYHQTIGGIMCLILLLAVIGNTLTIIVIMRYPSLRTVSNILVINLALSDLLMAVTGFPLYIVASFKGGWPFSSQACEFYGFAGGAFGLLSINTLAAIAVERYGVIVRPTLKRKHQKVRHTLCMVAFVWAYSLGWAFPPLAGWNRYTWEGFGTSCSFDYLTKSPAYTSFVWSMCIGGFVVPLICIIYCYMYILTTVISQKRQFLLYSRQLQARVMRGGRQYKRAFEMKTALTTLWCILLFCLSWTPYAVVSLLGELTDGSMITPLASVLPGLFAKASTIYNPIIYALSHPRINVKLSLLLRCKSKYFKPNALKLLPAAGVCSSVDGSHKNVKTTADTTLFFKTRLEAQSGQRKSSLQKLFQSDAHLSDSSSHSEPEIRGERATSIPRGFDDDVNEWNAVSQTDDIAGHSDKTRQLTQDKHVRHKILPKSHSQTEFIKTTPAPNKLSRPMTFQHRKSATFASISERLIHRLPTHSKSFTSNISTEVAGQSNHGVLSSPTRARSLEVETCV